MLKKISDALFARKQKIFLVRELRRLEEQYKVTRQFPEYGTSEDENAQEVEKFQENLGLQKSLKNLIKDVRSALAKIEKGKYGVCKECHQLIEPGRLKAYPAADLCVTCVSKKFHRK